MIKKCITYNLDLLLGLIEKYDEPAMLNIDINSYQGRVVQPKAYLTLRPTAPLNYWVKEFWQLNIPKGSYSYLSVPDNCVDIIVNLTAPEGAIVVTPFSSAKVFEMSGPVSYFGIRFNILGHQGIISTPIGEWNNADNVIELSHLIAKPALKALYHGIYKTMPFHRRCECVSKNLLTLLRPSKVDSRLMCYILYCNQNAHSHIDLSDKQCANFGISARQLRRLTAYHLGLTPKKFSKTLRFQQTLQAIITEAPCKLWTDPYYDQPHFNREFKSMAGATPGEFKTMSVLYNTN